jgi:hypothetical protein
MNHINVAMNIVLLVTGYCLLYSQVFSSYPAAAVQAAGVLQQYFCWIDIV